MAYHTSRGARLAGMHVNLCLQACNNEFPIDISAVTLRVFMSQSYAFPASLLPDFCLLACINSDIPSSCAQNTAAVPDDLLSTQTSGLMTLSYRFLLQGHCRYKLLPFLTETVRDVGSSWLAMTSMACATFACPCFMFMEL